MADLTHPDVCQATVADFDAATSSGRVLLSDRTLAAFDAAVFAASGLRLLRSGQRVAIRLHVDGTVASIGLPTLPVPRD